MMAKPADKAIQSGNSRVKVTIYGQVNKAFRVMSTGGESEYQTVDNDGSSSRLGIRAVGKINPDLSIIGWHEVEWQYNRRSATGNASDGNQRLRARHVDLSISHKNLGTVSVGKGSIAGDAADLYSLSGTGYVFGFGGPSGNDGGFGGAGHSRNWTFGNFFGARENRIRYQTPRVAGAMLEASANEDRSVSFGALYSGAPPGVKDFNALLRAGYRSDPNEDDAESERVTAWGVSGGIAHSSGFNVNGSYGTASERGSNVRPYKWNVEAGWGGKLNDMGKTNVTIGYGNYNDGMYGEAKYYYFAVNQAIDAAASDVYFGVSNDTGTLTSPAMDAVAGTAAVDAMDAGIEGQGTEGDSPSTTYNNTTGATYEDGEVVDHADISSPAAETVYTYRAATEAVEATPGMAAKDASSMDRDGVLVFIVGARIKF